MASPDHVAVRHAVPRLPARPREGHKGTFGTVLVVAGSAGMSGAAVLAGAAALRGGAGLVRVAVPETILHVVAAANPCYLTTGLPADPEGRISHNGLGHLDGPLAAATSVVLGPGLGLNDNTRQVVRHLLAKAAVPVLVDADGLNALVGQLDALNARTAPTILTPHPGEFARLTGKTTDEVQHDRRRAALAFVKAHPCVLALKGDETLVTDGHCLYTNTTGNPGMATGGTGDVLSGLVGALLGQGLSPLEATILGVHVHGLAGDIAAGQVGEVSLIATDLIDHLGSAFRQMA